MSNDKSDATFHPDPYTHGEPPPAYFPGNVPVIPGVGIHPVTQPLETLGQIGIQRTGATQPGGTGERPWISPGRPPWSELTYGPGPGPTRPSSNVAVWALVTGCVGVLAGWCLLGIPCVAAVILGHVGVAQTKDDRMTGRGMAVAGLVLGYVSLIPAVVLFFWLVAGGLMGGAGATVDPGPWPS